MPDDASPPNVTMTDVLALPDQQCQLVTWLMRRGETGIDAVATFLVTDDARARAVVADLATRGFVAERTAGAGDTMVVARVVEQRKRRVPSSVWDALDCTAARRDEA